MGIKLNDILFLSKDYCYICKDELYSKKYVCNDCMSYFPAVDGIKYIEEVKCYYPYIYEGKLKELIHKYKFKDSIYLYKVFGELLSDYITEKQIDFDIVIPVPLSRRKMYSRGYNQVELIADYIAKKLKRTMVKNGVVKIKNTKDQHLLSTKDRNKNLSDSFKIEKLNELKDKKILLLDDIVTSGNTIGEIIKLLNSNGIFDIKALVIGSTKKESKLKIRFKDI